MSFNEPDDDLEWEEWQPSKISFVNHMIAGSIAGLVEHVSVFPIDTIKTHAQYDKYNPVGPRQTWTKTAKIIKSQGYSRLWRGVSTMFAGCIPAHAAYFSVYEKLKVLLGADQAGHHPVAAAACGAAAAMSHDLFMVPFDVVKQRMQLGHYSSVVHGVKSIVRTEGLLSLYVSLPTTLMMNIPFGVIMVPVNESIRKILNPNGSCTFSASMAAGAIAGAVAAAFTTPLDVVKTRLQTQNLEEIVYVAVPPSKSPKVTPSPIRHAAYKTAVSHRPGGLFGLGYTINRPTVTHWLSRGGILNNVRIASAGSSSLSVAAYEQHRQAKYMGTTPKVRGMLQIMRQILLQEGYVGFTRGLVPRMLVHAPSAAVSWTAYEMAKSVLGSAT